MTPEELMPPIPSYIIAFVLGFVLSGFAMALFKAVEAHGL